MKKILLRLCRLFKTYPSLSLFMEEAKKKEIEKIKIVPKITVFEHLSGVEVYQGSVEFFAQELSGICVYLCAEAIVKPHDEKEEIFKKTKDVVLEKARIFKNKLEKDGFQVEIEKLGVY